MLTDDERYFAGLPSLRGRIEELRYQELKKRIDKMRELKEDKKTESKSMVNHPDHYKTKDSTYEPYKVIANWECNFNIGSSIKYLARYQKKFNPIEDLEKAKKYIDFEIERLKDNDTLPKG